jgi:peptidoglycan/xylan/chitin deacetylase (PgdA/CDA1 family)
MAGRIAGLCLIAIACLARADAGSPQASVTSPATVARTGPACTGRLYLTIDTGSMSQADTIARILRRHDVRATFFLANEPTVRGDDTLDESWADFWRERLREGHVFASHTWRHGSFRGDLPDGLTRYVLPGGGTERLDRDAVCAEIRRVDERFHAMTGQALAPFWRAPGGRTTPAVLSAAQACGYTHVGWSAAGFLGDELPSDKYPNQRLVARAVARLRDGDVMMMHTGIRSRRDPFAPMLDPLIGALKARGFCFSTLPERDPGQPLPQGGY